MSQLSAYGIHLLVGLSGVSLSEAEASLLAELQPAGIILFRKNIGDDDDWIRQLDELIADARRAAGRETLLVSIDHEGGRVHRLRAPCTHFPYARQWAPRSRAVAKAMGAELRALGFTLSFAPVLDVDSIPDNPVISARAFSERGEGVLEAARAFADGLDETGMLYCAKHFPGHGATVADSHFELPVLNDPEVLIRQRDIAPFAGFVRTGCPMIMTAHVRYPALDDVYPATLSPRIVRGILRDELGYQGVVITDDLEMAALAALSPAERAVRSLAAGVDLLLEGNPSEALPLDVAKEMALGLQNAHATGELSDELLTSSRQRIEHLFELQRRNLARVAKPPLTVLDCEEHRALLASIEVAGTLVG